ncbi:unnamed protein product [Blepharisma stoltei]|uniref:Reverse transcriptase n=1 Tax=Blepharisma stoltei TaxID=1481888 RepID=A0AAU9K452_9CILI|nr:unnamed protein product [Blepharisma stoltei]
MPESLRRQALAIKGVPLKASKSFRYLGYIIQTRNNSARGLNSSIAKTKASCMAQFGMVAYLRDAALEGRQLFCKPASLPSVLRKRMWLRKHVKTQVG